MKRLLFFLAVLFASVACTKNVDPEPAPAQTDLYFPPVNGTDWATTTPESLGWSVAHTQPLYDYLQETNTKGFLVLKDGKIVLEKYFGWNLTNTASFDRNSQWYWASAGKTLTSFMVVKEQQEN